MEPNCRTHPEDGKRAQLLDDGNADDSTCSYIADYDQGKEDEAKYAGWFAQPDAETDSQETSHYRVLPPEETCGQLDVLNHFQFSAPPLPGNE